MHDPMAVAFEIPRPFPRLKQPRWRNPENRKFQVRHYHRCDDPSTCSGCLGRSNSQMFPWYRPRSYTQFPILFGRSLYFPPLITVWHNEPRGADSGSICKNHWRWHVHHWSIQVIPWQNFSRWAFTRCQWCGGKSRKGDHANVSLGMDMSHKGKPFWRGQQGVFHSECISVYRAHQTCFCQDPLLDHAGYGTCSFCGKGRSWTPDGQLRGREALEILAAVPEGTRPTPEVCQRANAIWARVREAEDARRNSE